MTSQWSLQPIAVDGWAALKPLFEALDYHLAVGSAFAGASPARVFADDPEQPSLAVMWLGHRFYIAGWPGEAPADALRQLLRETTIPQALVTGQQFGLFYYTSGRAASEDWAPAIAAALGGLESGQAPRQYWECDLAAMGPAFDPGAVPPPGFTLRPVDAALLAETSLGNLERLAEETRSERPSVEDFLARSFGVCLVHEGRELAGWCLSEYNLGDRCEVGIETIEPYRRQGLGALMTRALLAEARRRGLARVGWHCWTHNLGSGATARSAGFTLVCDYSAFWARFASN